MATNDALKEQFEKQFAEEMGGCDWNSSVVIESYVQFCRGYHCGRASLPTMSESELAQMIEEMHARDYCAPGIDIARAIFARFPHLVRKS